MPLVPLPLPDSVGPNSTCLTCVRGCGCALTDPACGHYGCYGTGPRDCPGAAVEEARYAAVLRNQRAAEARRLTRRAVVVARLRAHGILSR